MPAPREASVRQTEDAIPLLLPTPVTSATRPRRSPIVGTEEERAGLVEIVDLESDMNISST